MEPLTNGAAEIAHGQSKQEPDMTKWPDAPIGPHTPTWISGRNKLPPVARSHEMWIEAKKHRRRSFYELSKKTEHGLKITHKPGDILNFPVRTL